MSDIEVKNESPKTVALQGEPGTGKSMMTGLTAVHQPVHVLDVDRKIRSAGWAQQRIKDKLLTVYELAEPVDDSNLVARMKQLGAQFAGQGSDKDPKGPTREPKGWIRFAEYVHSLPNSEDFKRCGTFMVDSATMLNEHLKTHLMYLAKRNKFAFDQWNALKIGWIDSVSVLRDLCIEHGKDLVITVHERFASEPGDQTLGMKVEMVPSGEGTMAQQRTYVGMQDIKILASIDGQFGGLLGAQCDEYYHLYVDGSTKDNPKWRCRVWPDGRRDLRTSFKLSKAVWEPNFKKIWSNNDNA